MFQIRQRGGFIVTYEIDSRSRPTPVKPCAPHSATKLCLHRRLQTAAQLIPSIGHGCAFRNEIVEGGAAKETLQRQPRFEHQVLPKQVLEARKKAVAELVELSAEAGGGVVDNVAQLVVKKCRDGFAEGGSRAARWVLSLIHI